MKKIYTDIIAKLANPDTNAEALTELSAALEQDEASYNKLDESNKALRDTNSRLAVKITRPMDPEPEPEKEMTWDDFQERIKEDLKERQVI